MRNIPKKKIAIAILAVALVAASVFHVYAANEGSGGFAIWNKDQAYFFVNVDRRGYKSSYLLFPLILFNRYVIGGFAAAMLPDDGRAFLVVLRVTSSGVERNTVKLEDVVNGSPGGNPSKYTPVDDQIYADCPPLEGLCRWAGDHFVPATDEERRRIQPERFALTSRLTTKDFNNDPSGWSRRVFVAGPQDRGFTMAVGSKFQLSLRNVGIQGTKDGTVSIDLLRPDKPSERIAVFETRQGPLTGAEYRHAFYGPE